MNVFFIFLITLSASRLSPDSGRRYFVVWNVGQGQWTTLVQQSECWHFDWGGEFFPTSRARAVCAGKTNRIFLSHWDWDHIGGLTRAAIFPHICLARPPLGHSSRRKEALLPHELCPDPVGALWQWRPPLSQNTNLNSQIFSDGFFLVAGDSPQRAERIWAARRDLPSAVKLLVLGHHGSRTSTSDFLLTRLPHLRQAVSSSRWGRYGHPHAETLARLKRKKIPVVRTQDWGSLWFER